MMEITSNMDCYEDMFKEITRKLYGEEGLPEIGNNGEHSGSGEHVRTLSEYEADSTAFKTEDGHSGALTAFGLAALMQNGFPPPSTILGTPTHHAPPTRDDRWVPSEETLSWTRSKVASYNPLQKLFRCSECECVGILARVAEHWLGAHANLRAFQCPQCPYSSAWARCVRMHLARQHNVSEMSGPLHRESPLLEEVVSFLQRLKTRVDAMPPVRQSQDYHPRPHSIEQNTTANIAKRYCCTFCPYATDRRDLFTRHENIHREEKPFQCYVCQKQFNRADHVKKHFLRMHRDYPYDLNRIRRQPPKNASGMSYYQKYNTTSPIGTNRQDHQNIQHIPHNSQMAMPPVQQSHSHANLNIPAGFSSSGVRTNNNFQMGLKQRPILGGCNAKSHGSKTKKKGEKRYTCCYCSWSGVDNWCLKRHLNTHLKPFVCVLCDYKAARSERLATHVLKVHNKRACSRCSFLADDHAQLTIHLQEHHPLEHRNNRTSNNVLRNVGFSGHPPSMATSFGHQNGFNLVKREQYDMGLTSSYHEEQYPKARQHYGAARLFHYMEASDTSDNEDRAEEEEQEVEEEEPPPFVCQSCGCEFVDDTSLDTHNITHHTVTPQLAEKEENKVLPYKCTVCGEGTISQVGIMEHMRSHSSIGSNSSKKLHTAGNISHQSKCPHVVNNEKVEQNAVQSCRLCDNDKMKYFPTGKEGTFNGGKCNTMDSNMNFSPSSPYFSKGTEEANLVAKRSRKQSQPRKVIPDTSQALEIEVHNHKIIQPWQKRRLRSSFEFVSLVEKYAKLLVSRKRQRCSWCRHQNQGFPYHSFASLALHRYWRHMKPKFSCEHCGQMFRHLYQVVLHSSRIHSSLVSEISPVAAAEFPTTLPAPSLLASALKLNVPETFENSKLEQTNFLKVQSLLDIPLQESSSLHGTLLSSSLLTSS